MAAKKMIISEKFHLSSVPQDLQALDKVLQDNEDFLLSAQDLIDTDHNAERIYEKVFAVSQIELAGGGLPGWNGNPEVYAQMAESVKAEETGAQTEENAKAEKTDAKTEDSAKAEETGEKTEESAKTTEEAGTKAEENEVTEAGAKTEEENAWTEAESGLAEAKNDVTGKNAGKTRAGEAYAPAVPASGDQQDLSEGIWVLADGVAIGRIRKTDRLHLQNLYQNYKITGLEAEVHGGRYRIATADEESEPEEKEGEARWSAVLTVYYRIPKNNDEISSDIVSKEQVAAMVAALTEKMGYGEAQRTSPAPAPAPNRAQFASSGGAAPEDDDTEDSERWGIDTSYETVRKEKDPAGRGLVFLLIGAVYATFYLCFSVPGWIPSMSAGASTIKVFGKAVTGLPGYVPGGIMIAGLIFNIIAMFTGGGVIPVIGSFLYLLAGFVAPKCVLFTAIPAVFCIFGALRKQKGNAALRYILSLAAAAAAAFLLYQYFTGTVIFSPFDGNDLTDWNSVVSYARGERMVAVENGDEDVYYEDESEYWEDETGWWEDESDFWGDEDLWWVEYETETETETDGNAEVIETIEAFGGLIQSGIFNQPQEAGQSGEYAQSGTQFGSQSDIQSVEGGQNENYGQSGEAGLL